jgi:NAD(P)-dependent dehydrogenase (short-subunit alcohol dehydrogenase family)
VAEITGKGGKALAVPGDVSKAADVKRLFQETRKAFGALDVLVNNAGVYKFEPLEAATEAEFHREFNTNVLGLILATQEAVKHFGPDGGSVINIGSVASDDTPAMSVVCTQQPRAPWTRSRACWPRSWDPGKYASTRLILAAWKPKAPTRLGSWAATSKSRWWRAPRWAVLANLRTSHRWRYFWPPRIPDGLPAKSFGRQVDFNKRISRE